jgi:hypothetical protein
MPSTGTTTRREPRLDVHRRGAEGGPDALLPNQLTDRLSVRQGFQRLPQRAPVGLRSRQADSQPSVLVRRQPQRHRGVCETLAQNEWARLSHPKAMQRRYEATHNAEGTECGAAAKWAGRNRSCKGSIVLTTPARALAAGGHTFPTAMDASSRLFLGAKGLLRS